jgi:hypothetical protein
VQLTRWLAAASLIILFAAATRTNADPDLWGHVRFGLDILQTHTLPAADPYSFTQDRPWINHEWLSEVQMGAAYAALGPAGLALLKGALALLALWLVWSALRGVRFEARLIATAAAAIGAGQIAQTLRPQLWSVVCLAILCRTLIAVDPKRRRWLPVLFLVWANLHGGWIVGLGVLALWLVVEAAVDPSARRRAVILLPLCALATLGTPYGWGLWRFVVETVRVRRPAIEEWQPLWALHLDKWIPWAASSMTIVWASTKPFARRWAALAVLAMLACASLRVARIAPLFVISAVILLAPRIAGRWPLRPTTLFGKDPRAERTLVAAAVMGACLGAAWLLPTTLRCVATTPDTSPDPGVLEALSHAPPGHLVTFFNWGELALWHLGPRIKVSMDGRRETVYTDERLAQHDAILFGTPGAGPILEAWQAEYVWLPATSLPTKMWLAAHGYRIDAETPRSFLAVRADLPRLVPSVSGPPPKPSCFPD